ncbi:MAG: SDR family oxidoreductase [Marmoricola sp.]
MAERFPGAATHLVTGASSGIGFEVARLLGERGDKVVMLVRSEDRIDPLAERLPRHDRILPLDLADADAVVAWAEEFGRGEPAITGLDSVIHCAGVVELDAVAELDPADWRRTIAVNLTAPALLTRGLLPLLRAARGTVVFVNSGSGLRANPQWASYNASKFGLRGLADALRAEEAEHGVRVTSVFPGRTATAMQEKVHAQEGKEYDAADWIRPETVAETVVQVLDLAEDATVPDVVIRPRAR